MGPRSPRSWFVALACCCALTAELISLFTPLPLAAAVGPIGGAWLRPVPGVVTRPFVAPISRYGAGHRGADLVAPAGTPVRAANAGDVSFAGSVAGSLHVVLAHPGGLRTSYSFLATLAVRRGERVARGDVIGTAGGGVDDHAGVLHLGLRVGDRYVDPMALFSPTDLTRLIRLVPVDEPVQSGLDSPALESRSLAESLHLPRGLPGLAPEPEPGILDSVGDALGEMAGTARRIVAPVGAPWAWIGGIARRSWPAIAVGAFLADAGSVADRLQAWARARADCTDDASAPAGGGGSGHTVLAVAGIDSSTDPDTHQTLALDTKRLGYRASEVHYFSYAPDGGPYAAAQTTANLNDAAAALGQQLRALQRSHPGREVDLIGHSQGGVVIAKFLAHGFRAGDPTLPPLGTVVTLSSPLQGAPVATAVRDVRATATGRALLDRVDRASAGRLPSTGATATAQLAEGSAFIRSINARPLPEQIDLTSLGAMDDFIVPADHAARTGEQAHMVNPAGPTDHRGVLTDPHVLDTARLALEQRPLPCVGLVDGVRGAIEPVVISRVEHTVGALGRAAGTAVDSLAGKPPDGVRSTPAGHSPSGDLGKAGSR